MNRLFSATHSTSARSQPAAAQTQRLPCHARNRRWAGWALASLLAAACVVLIAACGGHADPSRDDTSNNSTAAALSSGREVSVRASIDDPEWAPGETPPPLPRKLVSELRHTDGRARVTLPEDWPANPSAHWSGRRYATRAQLDHELTLAAPYTLVIDADDEAALETGLQYAETVHAFNGGKALLGVFVRSRQPALAARLAARLTA